VGNLPEEVQDTVATHLRGCAACVTMLDQLEDNADPVVADLRQPPEVEPSLAQGTAAAEFVPPSFDPFATAEPGPGREAAPTARPEVLQSARPATLPERIGRYRIERTLGKGSFGLVYLAYDEELSRQVAIKVPHAHMVAEAGGAQAYLTEARTVASLDHPNIVPVHDVGSTEQFPCFIVSKYIDGIDLASRLAKSRLSLHEAAELVATVAEALHHAHQQGLVHRDIKPGNLLLDKSGKAFVADFGLALREQDVGKGPRLAGTPAYMSPEQARSEGHRVDGRSDIFSLGVVFYELLTGRRPFRADAREELFEQITSVEARPPRQWDDTIPKELERICLRTLAKRATERYTTARDFADDLRHFLAEASLDQRSAVMDRIQSPAERSVTESSSAPPSSDAQPIKIVPKGLRAFDAEDANFFLELLPGPRDREGLPESLRFWKTRIERTDPDNTFAVGLIYGPSGCGKSSLVKAGLLPRLAKSVTVVYVEATSEQTEARLLRGLQRRVPELPSKLGLAESLTELRRGRFLASSHKVLLVLDQFEQWLHAQRREENTELVQALRQCDGGRVQCVIMVRDDFWMGATRFLRELEIRLLEGQNALAVDLFSREHARKVLAAFGRAFGKLPQGPGETTKEHKQFLDQVVLGLTRDGKIISVRLAVFAEMIKSKPWTPATLKEVGGTKGVGVNFLEETFTAASAPPNHRLHQKAAQAVLKALLPEAGTKIKGHMLSRQELAEASGYGSHPKDFDDLLHLLDGELRLITPTDPEGRDEGGGMREEGGGRREEKHKDSASSLIPHPSSLGYYQLAHDYLVPALREWLTRKQKGTRRGRAELLVADHAAAWNVRPENRLLPSLVQCLQILLFTRKENLTLPQRKMMRKARRYHTVRMVALAVLLLFLTLMGLAYRSHAIQENQATHGAGLVRRLLDAEIAQVPAIVKELKDYRQWADPLLKEAAAAAEEARRQATTDTERTRQAARQLRARLGLLPVDAGEVPYLYGRLLDAKKPQEVAVLRDALQAHRGELVQPLWKVALRPDKGNEAQRLRAACALAAYDADNPHWAALGEPVVQQLVTVDFVDLGSWLEGFRRVRARLLAPLAKVFRDRQETRATERILASNILADFAAGQPQLLTELLMDADERQFAILFPMVREQAQDGLPLLSGMVDRKLPPEATEEDREKLAKRQANAAVALVRMNEPAKVWPLLKHSPDPRVRSYLIDRLGPLGADKAAIVQKLGEEADVTSRRALLLSLGAFGNEAWSPQEKKVLVEFLRKTYGTEPDPGLHAAAGWLLRQWHEETWLQETDDAWAKDMEQRQARLDRIGQESTTKASRESSAPGDPPRWYVNSQGQTMVVVPGPVELVMGSPLTEAGRSNAEPQHQKRIGRTFAIAARPVTVAEYRRLAPKYMVGPLAHSSLCPAVRINWFQAATYCNWLSAQEGIPKEEWCYEANSLGGATKLTANYLHRTGYRLPAEAEWEFACRAGATTRFAFGEGEELLGRYGWYRLNSQDHSWPVGSKKPNDLGLFDMPGNVWCWCEDAGLMYPKGNAGAAIEDIEDKRSIHSNESRVLRGGSYNESAGALRSANRKPFPPFVGLNDAGFRPARTIRDLAARRGAGE